MTQLSELLLKKAEEIRMDSASEVAVHLLKQAGLSEDEARLQVAQHEMEKEACNQLALAGIDIDTAVKMVKAAGINLKDLVSFEPPKADVHPSVELLQKAAQYIDALEAEIESGKENLVKKAEEDAYSEVVLPSSITKAAGSGAFTNEDLAALQKMDQTVLTKIASALEEPWEMGRATGMARPVTDPMLEFILG